MVRSIMQRIYKITFKPKHAFYIWSVSKGAKLIFDTHPNGCRIWCVCNKNRPKIDSCILFNRSVWFPHRLEKWEMIFQSGNFENSGKVWECYTKYWKNLRKIGEIYTLQTRAPQGDSWVLSAAIQWLLWLPVMHLTVDGSHVWLVCCGYWLSCVIPPQKSDQPNTIVSILLARWQTLQSLIVWFLLWFEFLFQIFSMIFNLTI